MRKILLFALLVGTLSATGQSVLQLRADTVKIYKNNGYGELVLLNRTKDTTGGLLTNYGGGKTKFLRPYKINDTTLVIGLDTFSVGAGSSGLSESEVQEMIDETVALLNNAFDDSTIIGDGSVADKRRVNLTLIPTRETTDSLGNRIDSILINWPIGSTAGKTQIQHTSSIGDSIIIKVNDSLYTALKFIEGANITFTVTDSTFTINGISGSEELNTVSGTLSGTATITVSMESMIDYILVRPVSSLLAFKIGIAADDDKYFPATPVTAAADFVIFDVGAYLDASTPVQFSGVTSSTEIRIIYKPIHE